MKQKIVLPPAAQVVVQYIITYHTESHHLAEDCSSDMQHM